MIPTLGLTNVLLQISNCNQLEANVSAHRPSSEPPKGATMETIVEERYVAWKNLRRTWKQNSSVLAT